MIKKPTTTLAIIIFFIYLLGVIMTGSINPLDFAKRLEIRAMGIKPNVPFYESTRIIVGPFKPRHHYPLFPPITLEQAENAPHRVHAPYNTDLNIAVVGDNYQIKERWIYRRKPKYILLNEQQQASLKNLENGDHFFILDDNLQLQPITIEEAITLPNYIKVIREMGKIISIEKKTLKAYFKHEYEYWPHSEEVLFFKNTRYSIDRKTVLESLVVEFDKNGDHLLCTTKDEHNKVVYIEKYYPRGSEYFSERSLFNQQGEKTNIIYIPNVGENKNVHLDKNGNITEVTYEGNRHIVLADFEEDERYKTLQIDTSKKYKAIDSLEPEK
ncbi:hypothetical protein A9G11_01930 [Gilliamella sp. wkB108]|nr:hypothetical protein A9G11_01930 [Gilliamella apicola]